MFSVGSATLAQSRVAGSRLVELLTRRLQSSWRPNIMAKRAHQQWGKGRGGKSSKLRGGSGSPKGEGIVECGWRQQGPFVPDGRRIEKVDSRQVVKKSVDVEVCMDVLWEEESKL